MDEAIKDALDPIDQLIQKVNQLSDQIDTLQWEIEDALTRAGPCIDQCNGTNLTTTIAPTSPTTTTSQVYSTTACTPITTETTTASPTTSATATTTISPTTTETTSTTTPLAPTTTTSPTTTETTTTTTPLAPTTTTSPTTTETTTTTTPLAPTTTTSPTTTETTTTTTPLAPTTTTSSTTTETATTTTPLAPTTTTSPTTTETTTTTTPLAPTTTTSPTTTETTTTTTPLAPTTTTSPTTTETTTTTTPLAPTTTTSPTTTETTTTTTPLAPTTTTSPTTTETTTTTTPLAPTTTTSPTTTATTTTTTPLAPTTTTSPTTTETTTTTTSLAPTTTTSPTTTETITTTTPLAPTTTTSPTTTETTTTTTPLVPTTTTSPTTTETTTTTTPLAPTTTTSPTTTETTTTTTPLAPTTTTSPTTTETTTTTTPLAPTTTTSPTTTETTTTTTPLAPTTTTSPTTTETTTTTTPLVPTTTTSPTTTETTTTTTPLAPTTTTSPTTTETTTTTTPLAPTTTTSPTTTETTTTTTPLAPTTTTSPTTTETTTTTTSLAPTTTTSPTTTETTTTTTTLAPTTTTTQATTTTTPCYCVHGICVENKNSTGLDCACFPGWVGKHCDQPSCHDVTCGPHQICTIFNNHTECICEPPYTGTPDTGCKIQEKSFCVSGDPHQTTFDGLHFTYHGTCPYLAAKPCNRSLLTDETPYFEAVFDSHKIDKNDSVSYMNYVEISMYGQLIRLTHDRKLYINHKQMTQLPWYWPGPASKVIQVNSYNTEGLNLWTQSNIGLMFFSNWTACLQVPTLPGYVANMCGVGGTMDGNPNDDLRLRNGSLTNDTDVFANDWITDHTACEPAVRLFSLASSSICKPADKVIAEKKCQIMKDSSGPFEQCTNLTDFHYQDCVYDMCAYGNAQNVYCKILSNFGHQCQVNNPGTILHWRISLNCPLKCPKNQVYKACATGCPPNCSNINGTNCNLPCAEGCACAPNFVLENNECVSVQECINCTDAQGGLRAAGELWLNDNCSTQYLCRSKGHIDKYEFHCGAQAECTENAECKCFPGFEGNPNSGCTDINECTEIPPVCTHGNCTKIPGSYYCTCNPGWTGDSCDIRINYCKNITCLHGGTCQNLETSYTCECVDGYWGDLCQNLPQRDCADLHVYHNVTSSGVYSIRLSENGQEVKVYCDMDTEGGGWTLFQKRQNGSIDFYQPWKAYKEGFGSPSDEYWLGNDNLFEVTNQRPTSMTLRVELTDCANRMAFEEYTNFKISNETYNYSLHVKNDYHRGSLRDGITFGASSLNINGMPFSTFDNDNDNEPRKSCAKWYHGAFWYNACGVVNLNGAYYKDCKYSDRSPSGIVWLPWRYNMFYSAKTSKMMIRPVNFKTPLLK